MRDAHSMGRLRREKAAVTDKKTSVAVWTSAANMAGVGLAVSRCSGGRGVTAATADVHIVFAVYEVKCNNL
jgi:hypothetical protein